MIDSPVSYRPKTRHTTVDCDASQNPILEKQNSSLKETSLVDDQAETGMFLKCTQVFFDFMFLEKIIKLNP